MKDKRIQFIRNVASTNKLLADIARQRWMQNDPLPDFFAIATDFQSAGRGMGNHTWFSDRGENILVSIYFQPQLPAAKQFIFNRYFALITCEFVQRYTDGVQIKWPNDIYVHGKKIAGDLTEHTLRGNQLLYTIAGIGLNINQARFPKEIPHPTSLFMETGQKFRILTLLEEYHAIICQKFSLVNTASENLLHTQYLQHLYQYNEYHTYQIGELTVEAAIKDIDTYGRLLLSGRNGESYSCGFKEIVFL